MSDKLKLIKMRAELANLNDCTVPFLSRSAVNLSWCDIYIHNMFRLFVITFYVFTDDIIIKITVM